jgi:hypothetical protein
LGFYIQNVQATNYTAGPVVMATTTFDPSPIFYFGAINSWGGGLGNQAGNFYSGTLNFAFLGPGLSNTQLSSLTTLITTYNSILGR